MGPVRRSRQPLARPAGLDAGRPPGFVSLPIRAARQPGLVSQPEAPASGNRWGLGEAVLGFAAGLLLSAAGAAIAEAATDYHPPSSAPIPVAVTGADVLGLWLGLIGAVVIASRTRGSG